MYCLVPLDYSESISEDGKEMNYNKNYPTTSTKKAATKKLRKIIRERGSC